MVPVPTYSELKVVEGMLVDVVERRHDGQSEAGHRHHVFLNIFSALGKKQTQFEQGSRYSKSGM